MNPLRLFVISIICLLLGLTLLTGLPSVRADEAQQSPLTEAQMQGVQAAISVLLLQGEEEPTSGFGKVYLPIVNGCFDTSCWK